MNRNIITFVKLFLYFLFTCVFSGNFLSTNALAQSYRYMDEGGNINFVDKLEDVPARYRNQIQGINPTPMSVVDKKAKAKAEREKAKKEKDQARAKKKREKELLKQQPKTKKKKLNKNDAKKIALANEQKELQRQNEAGNAENNQEVGDPSQEDTANDAPDMSEPIP